MDNLHAALRDAWQRIRPRLESDPAELHRRLARRRSALIQHPPRAWCLAVRASDTRLDRYCIHYPDRAHGHDVILDSSALRRLCAPVFLTAPGESVVEVARKLGVTRGGLLNARVNGLFHTHYVEGLGGHWGKPHPLLYTPEPLDPSARGFASPDPLWSVTAALHRRRIPGDIQQILTRVPLYQPIGPSYRDTTGLQHEHPEFDPIPRKKKSLKLPPPPPDFVWYKWKGDEYLGYDWRNPLSKARYERRQERLANMRAAAKLRRRERGTVSKAKGSLQFRGWRWRCPGCRRPVNILYFPLPRLHLLPLSLREMAGMSANSSSLSLLGSHVRMGGGREDVRASSSFPLSLRERVGVRANGKPRVPQQTQQSHLDRLIARADVETRNLGPPPCFACDKCHGIRRQSRCDPNAWNEFVSYLSAGLLYGREVPRPAWVPHVKQSNRYTAATSPSCLSAEGSRTPGGRPSCLPIRKLPYTPRPNRAPSKRRPEIEQKLLAGQTFKQIAADLGIVYGTVLWHARQVYKQHGVRSLPELLRKHGQAVAPPPTHEVRRRLLAGESIAQIAAEMGVGKMIIYNQRQALRKTGQTLPDGRKQNGGKRKYAGPLIART